MAARSAGAAELVARSARLLVASEKEYRETLFRDFVKFCRDHGGLVISVPWTSPALVLVPLGDGETSRLEIALQRLPKYRVVKLPSMAARLSHIGSDRMQLAITHGAHVWAANRHHLRAISHTSKTITIAIRMMSM